MLDLQHISKLSAVIQCLGRNAIPRDDTMLEKLFLFLESSPEHARETKVLEDEEFASALHTVAECDSIEPPSLAAIVRIIGAVCCSARHAQHPDVVTLLHTCVRDPYSREPSVCYAWLCALSTIVALGVETTEWLIQQGFLQKIRDYTSNKSLFVNRNAKKLLATIHIAILRPRSNMHSQAKPVYQEEKLENQKDSGLDENCVNSLDIKVSNTFTLLMTSLRSIMNILKENGTHSRDIIDCLGIVHEVVICGQNESIPVLNEVVSGSTLQLLCERVEDETFGHSERVLQILTAVFEQGHLDSETTTRVKHMPRVLSQQGRTREALIIAVWLIHKIGSCEEVESFVLEQLQQLSCLKHGRPLDHRLFLRCLSGVASMQCIQSAALDTIVELLSGDHSLAALLSLNTKLRRACLESLCALLSSQNFQDIDYVKIIACAAPLLSDSSNYQIVSKALDIHRIIVEKLISHSVTSATSSEAVLRSYLSELEQALPPLLMNLQWQIRDTALHFLAHLARLARDSAVLEAWLAQTPFVTYVWQGVKDGDSYVRATTIATLQAYLVHPSTEPLVLQVIAKNEVFQILRSILKKDTEVFPRRAVVDLFSALYFTPTSCIHQSEDNESNLADDILHSLCTAITDCDWQVKVQILEFMEKFIKINIINVVQNGSSTIENNGVPEYAAGIVSEKKAPAVNKVTKTSVGKFTLERLCDTKLPQVLLTALNDHDKAVKLRACSLYKLVLSTFNIELEQPPSKRTKHDTEINQSSPETNQFTNDEKDGCQDDDVTYTKEEFIGHLRNVDIDALVSEAERSDDQYAENPESLFDDLLVAMAPGTESSNTDDTQDNASAVDCY